MENVYNFFFYDNVITNLKIRNFKSGGRHLGEFRFLGGNLFNELKEESKL